jgi:hypothetical protein
MLPNTCRQHLFVLVKDSRTTDLVRYIKCQVWRGLIIAFLMGKLLCLVCSQHHCIRTVVVGSTIIIQIKEFNSVQSKMV